MNLSKMKSSLTRRTVIPAVVAGALVVGGAWTFARTAAAVAPAAGPMDDSSVTPLLSLDQAMEALTARVRPAVVNVNVTAKVNGHQVAEDGDDGQDQGQDQDQDQDQPQQQHQQQQFQQFFGPGSPFGQFFQGPMQRQQGPSFEHGLGSGVIISPDGYIVTNNHVIDGATDIRVTLTDRRILSAKLIGADPLTDLAVIKVEGNNLPSAPLGDSTKLHPGQTVLAFGNPLGFRFTVTRGIVSALNRPNPFASDRRSPGEFIQTDAAINPGNSGGPLVNAHGEVVGINTFLISESGAFSGMGFAIPTQIVRPTVESLMRYGRVNHGYMGIGISDVTPEEAKFFHVDNASGAVVTQVEPRSPAAKAGLKVGDVITELDGKTVADAGELQVEVGHVQE